MNGFNPWLGLPVGAAPGGAGAGGIAPPMVPGGGLPGGQELFLPAVPRVGGFPTPAAAQPAIPAMAFGADEGPAIPAMTFGADQGRDFRGPPSPFAIPAMTFGQDDPKVLAELASLTKTDPNDLNGDGQPDPPSWAITVKGGGPKKGGGTKKPPTPTEAPSDYERLMAELRAKGEEMAGLQRADAGRLKDLHGAYAGVPVQTDLTALAALVDQWSTNPSNLAAAYQKPETGQERQAQLSALQAGIQRAETGAVEGEMAVKRGELDTRMGIDKMETQKSQHAESMGLQRAQLALEREKLAQAKAKAPDIKEHQWNAARFGRSMERGNKIVNDLLSKPGAENFYTSASSATQQVGMFPQGMKSDAIKQFENGKKQFILALLRDESGASIGTEEFKNKEIELFPQWGDDAKTLANKKKAREENIRIMAAEAGNAYDAYGTQVSGPASEEVQKITVDQLKAEKARRKGGG